MPTSLLDRVSLGVHAAAASPQDVVAVAQRIERAGLYGISVGDSALDSFSVLSAVAAATTRIHLRTGVALLGRSPVQTVFAAATVDQFAQGRFRLGIGVGSREKTAGWHDLDYSRPVGRLRDFVAAVRAAWATTPGHPQSFDSPHYRFRHFAVIRPNFTERLPIDLGVNGPQMLRLGGAVADGVMFNDLHTGAYLREVALPEVARGEQSAGRPVGSVRRIGAFSVSLASTREAAIARARSGVQAYLSISHNRNVLAHYGFEP
ncbi:MAG: LLM class flavin-dependent oxidoreductase, partial [Dehalococcoidia bacterium]|nr:LLM class flavin-dependent oxidoreductase [Dehalococcoidia bacterium]